MKLLNLSPANSLPTPNNPARTVMFKRSMTWSLDTSLHKAETAQSWWCRFSHVVSLSTSATIFTDMEDKKLPT